MILESIVTTVDKKGLVNIAPMGPLLLNPDAMRRSDPGDPGFLLRPFEGSRTCENLHQTRRATIHVTDDAELFATTAVGKIEAPAELVRFEKLDIDGHPWPILKHCHRWFAVEVETIAGVSPRFEMSCRVAQSGIESPFFGFNRAKHAVIEASILATRTHLLDAMDIQDQLQALRPLIQKTAGSAERRAFEKVELAIEERLAAKSMRQDQETA